MMSPYIKEINQKLSQALGIKNPNALPKLTKVVINYRVSEGRESKELLAAAEKELMAITGQKPRLTRSKKSVAAFKLRQGEPLAYKVTLRSVRMYDFINKLFNLVLPRLRDFKGLPLDSFDGQGNYSLTIRDQTYFSEIDLDVINKIRSVEVTLCISASSIEESKMLLSTLGFPFEKSQTPSGK